MRNPHLRRAIGSATLLLLAASAGGAQEGGGTGRESFRVVQIQRRELLSIRERPDATAPVVADIPWNGRGIRGYGCTSETPSGRTWCRVKFRSALGWARRFYLQPE